MQLQPHGRRKENNYGSIGLIFFSFIIRHHFRCWNSLSVECFSSMTTTSATTKSKTHTTRRTVSSSTPDNFKFLWSTEMTMSPSPYFGDFIKNEKDEDEDDDDDYNEEDDEDFMIFEEELRNDNPEQRIIEQNRQRNRHNSINQDSVFQQPPWDPSFSSSISSDSKDNKKNGGSRKKKNVNDILNDETMSDEQAQALNCIMEGRNVFVTGVAGTGKSLVLKKALEYIQENYQSNEYVAVAPTGSTAIALEGQTMHSFAGIGIPKIYTDFSKMKSNKKTKKKWEDLKVLVLDEVSMVSGEFFDSLSKVVSDIRKDPRPFGGIQLVVCGDFLQLSPIAPRQWEVNQMVGALQEKEGLETPQEARDWLFLNRGFCFQSAAWSESAFEVVELKHVFRQSNREFVNILQNIRVGNVTSETIRYLKENCERPLPPNDFGIQPTILHSKNVNVAKENLVDLNKLSGDIVSYEALDEVEREKGVGPWVKKQLENSSFFKSCIAEQDLQLKIGAQVMLIKNINQNSRLANGSRGTVVGFRKVKKSSSLLGADMNLLPGVTKYPVVQFKNGMQQVITPQKFQSRLLGMGTCTRTAIPLKLAWAITTHKAQGLTLDYVIADVGQVFAEAQLYVALSRASDETGLELRNFSKNRVKANPLALQFHQNPRQQYPFWWDGDGSKPMIMMEASSSESIDAAKKKRRRILKAKSLNEDKKLISLVRISTSTSNVGTEKRNNGQSRAYDETSSELFVKQSLTRRTVVELKDMLRERSLKVSGRKAELIERLITRR